ncbi:MAG TPA: helix-turn-helix domain-containing protein, partial [Pseudonocardia sp.]|uniref:PucR family transcriptional regulator n=1 Tax=Pseudonocardia sp. TaxID=60912 RepID=UPI002CAC513E
YRAVSTRLQSEEGAIGVGGPADVPSKLPRSYSEAIRALRIRQQSMEPNGVTVFGNLGIYRLLATGDGEHDRELREFVREWLGPLIDYDITHRYDLVTTLWQYYENGGNYDATAHALLIHRSTLRYRLRRIRELTGHDLGDVSTRLNLHIATRAWQIQHNPS